MKSCEEKTTNSHRFYSLHYFKLHLPDFTQQLSQQGFTSLTIQSYVDAVTHFDTWLKKKNIALDKITRDVVVGFSKHSCHCRGSRKKHIMSSKYIKRVQRFVDFIEQQGIIHQKSPTFHESRPPLLVQFRASMNLRGLSPLTLGNYEHSVSKLLPLLGDDPKDYTAKNVRDSICNLAQKCSRSEAKNLTTALRAYLRFLAVEGLCRPNLDCAVPTVAQWSLSSMPRYITAQEIIRVIDSCDIHTHKGLRDRAILLLLARLGLRSGDIVSMRLDDIHWSEGTLRVKGKGNREDLLPLPQKVGDAILAYLKKARPAVAIEQIFLCLNAPYRPFASSSPISTIVDTALSRADILNPPSRGAHLLRHSAATDMLRSGASLETVSLILRHRSLDMTAYYAKVDIPMLQQVAQLWPEGGSC